MSTTDGGTTWTTAQVADAGGVDLGSLGSNGNLAFSDSRHGWLNIDRASSAAFLLGATLSTNDGGKTWNVLSGDPAISGQVAPVTTTDGWIAGGPGNTNLSVTHDGGSTFQQVNLPAPSSVAPAQSPTYAAPLFTDAQHGYLAVTYSGAAGVNCAAVLYVTSDGGNTWTADRVLKIDEEGSLGQMVPTTVAGGVWILPDMPPGSQPAILAIPQGALVDPRVNFPALTNNNLDFLSVQQGCIDDSNGAVYCTADGGGSWILFAAGSTPHSVSSGTAAKQAYAGFAPLERIRTSQFSADIGQSMNALTQHLGFDTSILPATAAMQAWWTSSPYYDAAFYLNGSASHVNQQNLTSDWVAQVKSQGWGLIPAWSGPQPSCACRGLGSYPSCSSFPHTISTDPTVAFEQGQQEADKASDSMTSLRLKGGIVYVDLESYSSAACGAAVRKFVGGWTQEMESLGTLGGVYATAINVNDFTTAAPVPDDVWVARYDRLRTSWNLGRKLNPSLPDSAWPNHQRIHQYEKNAAQNWGGYMLKIDTNLSDAMVIAGNGTKTYSFYNPVDVVYPSGITTASTLVTALANNIFDPTTHRSIVGNVLGYYYDSSSSDQDFGFEYDFGKGSFKNIYGYSLEPTGVNAQNHIVGTYSNPDYSGGAFLMVNGSLTPIHVSGAAVGFQGFEYVFPSGINDEDWVIGSYNDHSGAAHCFLYKNGASTAFNAPGATGSGCYGINGIGQIVGSADAGPFIDDAEGGNPGLSSNFTNVPVPTSQNGYPALLLGINDNGIMVGSDPYGNSFLIDAGQFVDLSSTGVRALGLNDEMEIVGTDNGENKGELLTPITQ